MDDETKKYIDKSISKIYGKDPRIRGTGGILHWDLYKLRKEIWDLRDTVNELYDRNKHPIMIRMKAIEEHLNSNQVGLQNVYDQFSGIKGLGDFENLKREVNKMLSEIRSSHKSIMNELRDMVEERYER